MSIGLPLMSSSVIASRKSDTKEVIFYKLFKRQENTIFDVVDFQLYFKIALRGEAMVCQGYDLAPGIGIRSQVLTIRVVRFVFLF